MIGNLAKKELFISVLIHSVFIAYLSHQYSNSLDQPIYKKISVEPIKSFLYNPAKTPQLNKLKNLPNKLSLSKNKTLTKKTPLTQNTVIQKSKKSKKSKQATLQTVKNLNSTNSIRKNRVITKESLQKQINNINKGLFYEYKQPKKRSTIKSIFNPSPTLVPKSTTISPAVREQKKKQRITNYSSGISIQKDEQGNCSVTQDLTSVGIEGVSATQHFKCGGKTKFEKIFSQHMKEAMKKYK